MQDLAKQAGTWKWGLLCLVFLAPFFFLSYGFANQYASQLANVPVIVFEWEKLIPLWPWTIVPYWSIDLFYGLSLILCWNKFELRQHVLRLFTAQIISISCFLLFPLRFSFERPELSGFFGLWFDVLMGFDKPFNQAPSLHIVLLIILWDFFRRHSQGWTRKFVDFWSLLIGLSVLTTWQHHFIDIPTGILVGALCLWLFPMAHKSPFKKDQYQKLTPKHLKLGLYYLIPSLALSTIAFYFKGAFLWFIYPAVSLLLVSLSYFFARPHFFQKQSNGTLSHASLILYAPYLIFAWVNSRIWTKKHSEDSKIVVLDNLEIYLGRIPDHDSSLHYQGLFDCCAELPIAHENHSLKTLKSNYQQYLSLDLIPVQANQLAQAVSQFDLLFADLQSAKEHLLDDASNISHHQKSNLADPKLLIFCALGYSRSSAILCAWLLKNKHVDSVQHALEMIQTARPWIVINDAQLKQLQLYHFKSKGLAP